MNEKDMKHMELNKESESTIEIVSIDEMKAYLSSCSLTNETCTGEDDCKSYRECIGCGKCILNVHHATMANLWREENEREKLD